MRLASFFPSSFFVIALTAAAACSASEDAPVTPAANETPAPSEPSNENLVDAGGGGDVKVGAADTGSPPNVGKDAAPPPSPPVNPKPPTGMTMCSSGTFTAQDVTDACTAGTNGFGCDGIATNGGRYEVWCSASAGTRWLWVRFDDARSTGTLKQSCGLSSSFKVEGFYHTTNLEGGVGFGPTGFGSFNPGQEIGRGMIDDLPGNHAAVFDEHLDTYAKVQLSLHADCPKIGAVKVSPLKWTFTF